MGDDAVRVRYKRDREPQFYESMCLTTTPRDPPRSLRGPLDHCTGCPYPAHGFVCWGGDKCIRTEMARIMERDKWRL